MIRLYERWRQLVMTRQAPNVVYTVLLLPLPNSTWLNLLCIRPCFLSDQKCAKSSQKRLSSRTTWRAEFRQVTTYFLCTNLFLWTPTPVICNRCSNKSRNEFSHHYLASLSEVIQLHIVLRSDHLLTKTHKKCKRLRKWIRTNKLI